MSKTHNEVDNDARELDECQLDDSQLEDVAGGWTNDPSWQGGEAAGNADWGGFDQMAGL